MSNCKASCSVLLVLFIVGLCSVCQYSAAQVDANQTANLIINASISRPIPETLFGIFFEEINHAGAGGIWAELVSNRGFEAGGQNTPSNIAPWSIIARAVIFVPAGGVGIYNPGFWGMNIEQGKVYKVVLFVRSLGSINVSVSLTSSDGSKMLATANILDSDVSNWTKVEVLLEATGTNPNSRLQLTTSRKGVIWFDQVSAMPVDTYKGHGFRNELIEMLDDIKPQFIRFPGGCFIEGEWLRNAFRWKESIGPWEERPGHFGDVWMYWTDDGLGYFEFLQLAEDLGSRPIWVFNNGISHQDQVDTTAVLPFVQEALDGLEFARGDSNSKWGSKNYRGNYLKFYNAIRSAYPDIKIISNCDGSSRSLDHPADYYDFHIYTSASNLFSMTHQFDRTSRTGPKVCNSDIVEMASYAPLFVNVNDRRWNPDAIVFNSSKHYGTPSYWVQKLFRESSGANLLDSKLQTNSSTLVASAITWQNSDGKTYLKIKIVNFGNSKVNLKVSIDGLGLSSQLSESTKTVLTSSNLMDENSFSNPKKVVPAQTLVENADKDMDLVLTPYSVTSFDLLTESNSIRMPQTDSFSRSSI
ncbi:hypothetical protein OIU84_026618 [Salix udensis]|uniref:non-reducing end alpha-L-arabinofuranosidase n=1 Tax=Salix udensis TaxID=889485 RepID=A0AAD6PEF6_9ROSI|nr:hypothetical protein OIU84_026618 [Salix udensis]